MHSFIICYDLNTPGQNYRALDDAIKSLSGSWWHPLDSTWIIKHPGPAATIRDALAAQLDRNDELLVALVAAPAAWRGFNTAASSWLSQNL